MQPLVNYVGIVHDFFWGAPMIILFLGTGLALQINLKFMPIKSIYNGFRAIFHSWRNSGSSKNPGQISSYAALMTGLASTVGTGNIVGVASAIAIGGPGSVFWMWCTAITGIATKYAEVFLSVRFRRHKDGEFFGGPMYVILDGMGKKWRWLATMFAVFTIISGLGTGTMTQINSISDAMWQTFAVPHLASGAIAAVLIGFITMGGIKRIGKVAHYLVPWMCVSYVGMGLFILLTHFREVPSAFCLIFKHAFHPTAAIGGFAGSSIMNSIRYGIARGVFCNEAGTGTAAIAQAAGKTDDAVNSGMIGMMGVFIDTMFICTITALVVIVTGTWTSGNIGIQLFSNAVEQSMHEYGVYLLDAEIIVFAFTTILAWSYYTERAWVFLFSGKSIFVLQIMTIGVLLLGSVSHIKIVWLFSDLTNALMAIPNIISIVFFIPLIRRVTNDYLSADKKEQHVSTNAPSCSP
ncbi:MULTISPECIES: alanine/glycine:cation symporter family protein [Candidatus Ichthyocystis]|uniref:Sodium:alanine symporter n=2 Tax=Candidatus Ichthyocystis TaxID=2929841 RepID=A0A0S4M4J8_9BURK|nr:MULTISPECIES: sodium:alanine symporter family protein [Ichthyocystis]CUT17642.1 Sodium:alanine symporter [Candidatus Ichthyocystis hellenicum]